MDNIEIYFKDNSEYADFEAHQKGYRLDVFVKVGSDYFNISVFDIIRLNQDFELAVKTEGYYSVDPNLVILKDITRQEIKYVVSELYKQEYFNCIKPFKGDTSELKQI